MRGIEVSPRRRAAPATRAAVQHHDRYPFGIAALFEVDLMALPDRKHPLIERVDRRIKILNSAFLIGKLIHTRPIYSTKT